MIASAQQLSGRVKKKAAGRVIGALTASVMVFGFGAGYLSGLSEPVVVEPLHPTLDATNTLEPGVSSDLPVANLLLGPDNFSSAMNPPDDEDQAGADQTNEAGVAADHNQASEAQQ